MYPAEHFPMSVSGTGYLFPISIAECLVKNSANVPFLVLEDVYVTGLLSKYCQVVLKNSENFLYMGIGDMDAYVTNPYDVMIHRVNMDEMHDKFKHYWKSEGDGYMEDIMVAENSSVHQLI